MPAKSPAMQRFMGMCSHADHPPATCPSRKVAAEFAHKPPGGYGAAAKRSTRGSPAFTEQELRRGYRTLG